MKSQFGHCTLVLRPAMLHHDEYFTAWERGDVASRPDKQVRLNVANAAGVTVPELDGSFWLNTDK